MAGIIEQFTMEELDILKHDDLRKFAVDQGIEIPANITTKKALVPYLYEILNKPPETHEQKQSEKIADEVQTYKDTRDDEPESSEGVPEETDSDQEPDEAEDDVDRYIRTETSNGVLVYDRKTHSAVMERRV